MTYRRRLRRGWAQTNWAYLLRHPWASARFGLASHLPLVPWGVRAWIGGDEWTGGQNPDESG